MSFAAQQIAATGLLQKCQRLSSLLPRQLAISLVAPPHRCGCFSTDESATLTLS